MTLVMLQLVFLIRIGHGTVISCQHMSNCVTREQDGVNALTVLKM